MLEVTVSSDSGDHRGLFDDDDIPNVVERVMRQLVENHKFFKENRVHVLSEDEKAGSWLDGSDAYGIMLMPGEVANSNMIDGGSTTVIYVSKFEMGTMAVY